MNNKHILTSYGFHMNKTGCLLDITSNNFNQSFQPWQTRYNARYFHTDFTHLRLYFKIVADDDRTHIYWEAQQRSVHFSSVPAPYGRTHTGKYLMLLWFGVEFWNWYAHKKDNKIQAFLRYFEIGEKTAIFWWFFFPEFWAREIEKNIHY